MTKSYAIAVAALVTCVSLITIIRADAADAGAFTSRRIATSGKYCENIWRCGPNGCNWHHVCSDPCPDGYSCTPLYGAYGPYGGPGYWGAYTDSGWRYYR